MFLLVDESTYINVSRTAVNIGHQIVSTAIAKFNVFKLCLDYRLVIMETLCHLVLFANRGIQFGFASLVIRFFLLLHLRQNVSLVD